MGKAGKQEVVNQPPITVHVNQRDSNKIYKYPTNYIRTTKYTLLTFVPLNLYQQFKKMSNIFFLVNMIIALVPGVSPVFPATTILPLVAVLGVAAARDAWEDYHRYLSDKRANSLEVKIVDLSGKIVSVSSKDVQVGDMVYLERGSEIPVDCLVISTAQEDGACFVETANLDGETNLKPKQSRKALHVAFNSPGAIPKLGGTIKCDAPNNSLHKWQGTVSVPSVPDQSVDMDCFLLRGCTARNVDWVIAVTVYTGTDTKLFLNLTQKPPKSSRLDSKLNRLILAILFVQQLIIMLLCGMHVAFRNDPAGKAFYLQPYLDEYGDGAAFGFMYMTFFILLSLMMPISLFVSLEFCKGWQAKLMEWDDGLANGNDRTRARTSSLNEELSQVQYIFSDKTGTLTENLMRFAKAYAGGRAFDELNKPGEMQKFCVQNKGTAPTEVDEVHRFLRLLSLCNAVVVNTASDGTLTYEGSSTDEVALVDDANLNGYKLLSRTNETMTVDVLGRKQVFDVPHQLPFTADRKMMSVVVREKDGTMRLLTKGADSAVMARCGGAANDKAKVAAAQQFLNKCAEDGLRTLVCAERVFTAKEYEDWLKQWNSATLTVSADRDSRVYDACLAAERDLTYVGATAIEDKLQDEVPETIHFLLKCGIVIWVLTGDKRETAVNIASTSRLLDPQKDLVVHIDTASGVPAKEQLLWCTQEVQAARSEGRKASFVVDGKSLETILQAETFELFRDLGLLVNSAVCCRVTPLQKASVVAMFQELGATCLGVGDGANDVSMIQEARVGIGILGLEGSQAERASDYAVPRFRHLRRLIAVHGRYSMVRNSHLIQYSFYKNILYSLTHVYYAFYNGFSGQTIYDSWVIIIFNMAFTFFPPLVMGMFDYDVREDFLLRHPGLYNEMRSPFAVRMSRASSWMWSLLALYHSWVIFYGTYNGVIVLDNLGDHDAGMWSSGTSLMNLLLAVVIAQAGFSFLSWTWLHVLSIVLSFASYTVFMFGYGAVSPSAGYGAYYQVPTHTYGYGGSWANLILWFVVIFAPELLVQVVRRHFFGVNMHAARTASRLEKKQLPWKEYEPSNALKVPPSVQKRDDGAALNDNQTPLIPDAVRRRAELEDDRML